MGIDGEFYANLLTVEQMVPLPTIYIQRKKVLEDGPTIKDVLGVLNPPNSTFEEEIREFNLEWEAIVLETDIISI